MAVTVDPPEKLQVMKTAAGASFDFISDSQGRLVDLFDIRHSGGSPEGGDVPQSAHFLLSPDGRVLWRILATYYRVRPTPKDILAVIDALPPA
jgi:peroxiredoxin